MSLLGKILAFLNIVGAAALVVIASSDWGKRQSWTYTVFRQDLALNGLPLDEDSVNLEGEKIIDKLSDQTFQDLFKPGSGLPGKTLLPEDKTQIGEVKRVHDRWRAEINALPDDNTKRAKLSSLLVPLARTLGERETLLGKIASKDSSSESLLGPDGPFESAFNRILGNAKSDDKVQDKQRLEVAHLLFGLSQDDSARQRTAVVVGLKNFNVVVERQADALRDMAQSLTLMMIRHQGSFTKEHQGVIGELQLLAQQIADRKAELEKQKELIEKHTKLLNARSSDVQDLQDQIETARKQTKEIQADLAKEQQRLFELTLRVGWRVEQNLEFENEIRKEEKVNR